MVPGPVTGEVCEITSGTDFVVEAVATAAVFTEAFALTTFGPEGLAAAAD